MSVDMLTFGCGVLEHDEDCLCDVIITDPVSIDVGLRDNWALHAVAKYFDMSVPFSAEDFGFLLEKTDKFLEAHFAEKRQMTLDGFVPYQVDEGLLNYYERVKEYFIFLATAMKGDILPSEIAAHMKLSNEEFIHAMTHGAHQNKKLSVEILDFMVTEMRNGATHNYLYKNCGVPRLSAQPQGLVRLCKQILVIDYLAQRPTTGD